MSVSDETIEFIRSIQPMEKGELGLVQQECLDEDVPMIPTEVSRLLCVLLSIKKPENILEIGCAHGFSSSLMSKYVENGTVTTIDRFPVMIEKAKANFIRLNVLDKVNLIEGDALDVLPTLTKKYDVIFLDAGKGQYINLLPDCLRLLNKDGILIADDVLQDGRVAADIAEIPRRQRTIHRRLRDFLYTISNTKGLESCILPVGDGVSISYKMIDDIVLLENKENINDNE